VSPLQGFRRDNAIRYPRATAASALGFRVAPPWGFSCNQDGTPAMSQSLSNILVHVIYSTKGRQPFLRDSVLREGLHGYLTGVLRNLDSPSLIVGGVADHVHFLCRLSRKIANADLVKEVKLGSSKWVKKHELGVAEFNWQSGYAAFSVSPSNAPHVSRYIVNQEAHHRKVTF
jgi:putative transposase